MFTMRARIQVSLDIIAAVKIKRVFLL